MSRKKQQTGRGRRRAPGRRRVPAATRPQIFTLAAFLVVASLVAGYLALSRPDDTTPTAASGKGGKAGGPTPSPTATWDGKTHVLGDGSTSDTGPQKGTLKPVPLKPGEKPPQFVVFSWDGALEGDDHLFSHYREMAKEYNAHMTFFLTGIYLLPKSKKDLYHGPMHEAGDAAIDYPTDGHIRTTLEQLRLAYEQGNDIGTHFNGHFCGAKGGGDWSVQQWKSEIDQFYSFVENWKTNTGYTDIPPLPFDFKQEVTGGRAPCLEGQPNLLKAIKSYGWRYDASSPGDFQIWPAKKDGVWDFPLQMLPYENGKFQGLSMDFNFLYNQSNGETDGDPAKYAQWEQQTVDSYMAGFNRVYYGSRAPLFFGNHFEHWNGSIYMKSIDQIIPKICTKKGVKCVSFKELADWMDVQKPSTLAALRGLDPAQSPDWSTVVK
ncbi:lipoprotein [Streptomyces griseofuscus]|uniref:Lipoprotein n=1 Tax=Streptomyces griseofuscus TaxID=146922 RepID=A0A7H1Q5Q7_9ACTN|nr:lipoprotein [Streptomyces griseofuscus]QNT95637.1 lipoprotein [Streptomyces griseofuscus]